MPEKEGAEEKTTKSVVNKKQKQMMNKEEYTTEMVKKIKKKISVRAVFPTVAQNKVRGEIIKGDDLKIDNKNPVKKKMQKKNLDEEGYDIARDMGRVKPSKDKKDASSYPVSKEVRDMKGDTPMQKEFKKKYGKKATALDAVKQKYKGQMMDVKKEELDLTKVAETFGGYIIVEKLGPDGQFIPDDPKFEKSFMRSREGRNIRKKSSPSLTRNMSTNKEIEDAAADQTNQNYSRSNTRVTQNLSYPKDDRRTTGHDTEDFVEPEPEKKKTKKKTKTVTDRRLQRIRIAAKKTKKPIVKTAKYIKKNPFATLVGASMAKDQFFPAALPKAPTVQGGKVGRRTAG